MWKQPVLLILLGLNWGQNGVSAFSVLPPSPSLAGSSLYAVRQPRRYLKKRKGRERKNRGNQIDTTSADPNQVIELKPLIAYKRQEAGEDFWIDPKDLARENARQQAVANRKSMEGEMSKEKLIEEVVAPYKQNWIGIMSIVIVVLAAIVTNFPELVENPSIRFPDLDAGDPIPMQSTLKRAVVALATEQ